MHNACLYIRALQPELRQIEKKLRVENGIIRESIEAVIAPGFLSDVELARAHNKTVAVLFTRHREHFDAEHVIGHAYPAAYSFAVTEAVCAKLKLPVPDSQ